MSLRRKIISILLAAGICYGLVDFAVQKWAILPSFQKLENDLAIQNLERFDRAIENEINHLSSFCSDWAAWDDTALFVQGKKEDFISESVPDETFSLQNLNVLLFVNSNLKVVWSKCVLIENDKLTPVTIRQLDPQMLNEIAVPIRFSSPEDNASGIILTEYGPVMISSRPITNNKNELPVVGTIIMGRLIRDDLMKTLAEQIQVQCSWWSLASETTRQFLSPVLSRFTKDNPVILDLNRDYNTIQTSRIVRGLNQEPVMLIQAITPRHITAQGKTAIRFALYSLYGGGILIFVILVVLIDTVILRPVGILQHHAAEITQTGDLSRRVAIKGTDEIASLANTFNRMTEQLHQVRSELMDRSFQAGISELASGILHNVRNCMTSLRVEIDSLNQKINAIPLQHIETARQELANPDLPPERRKQIETFLSVASQSLTETLGHLSLGFQEVSRPLGQIEQYLICPENLSRKEACIEDLNIGILVQTCITMQPGEIRNKMVFITEPRLSEIPSIQADRLVLMHILCNLLSNAVDALADSTAKGYIIIDGGLDTLTDKPVVHIVVRDNGRGIPENYKDHLFQRGFTTKKENHGFGLHWCANTLNAMGGRIWAESDGPGKGAALHIMFPYVSSDLLERIKQ